MDNLKEFIEKLQELESSKNDGRGICSIRTILCYLNRGDIKLAKVVTCNEWDKISSYYDIVSLMLKYGFVKKNGYLYNFE